MATPTEPATTEPTGALFRALRSVDVDPDLAYRADDEVRAQAGQNVVAAIGAKIDVQFSKIESQITDVRADMKAEFAKVNARIDAQTSRIDVLQRVIWPLVVLIASTVFGLLYRVLTTTPG